MKRTSEFVSLGHPDKLADYISSYLLDQYLERDPMTRYAVECQVKDAVVTLGGEVSSRYDMPLSDVKRHVRDAIRLVGYTPEYARVWGLDNLISCGCITVNAIIGQQSRDIARGVDSDGWGDQGIFWGMATTDERHNFMPFDHYLASELGRNLYRRSSECEKRSRNLWGIDIKTQIEETDGIVTKAVVAAPCLCDEATDSLTSAVIGYLANHGAPDAKVIVNGTGRFVTHGPIGDCGTTGRKLAVDFYGGNCRVGGGSPWTKDGTKADVALNLYARKIALRMMRKYRQTVYVSISSVIGQREISVQVLDEHNNPLEDWVEGIRPYDIISSFGLHLPKFCHLCACGLFYSMR